MQSERRSRIGARRGHLESCSSNWFRLDVEAWICLRLWRGLRWSIVNQVCVENSIQVMSVTSLVSKSKNCFCRELCLHFERVTVRFVRRPGWNLAEGSPGAEPAGKGEPKSRPPGTTAQFAAGRLTSLHEGVNKACTRGVVPGAAMIFAAMLLGFAAVTAWMNCGVSM